MKDESHDIICKQKKETSQCPTFVAAYSVARGVKNAPEIELIFRITPRPLRSILGSTKWVIRATDSVLLYQDHTI